MHSRDSWLRRLGTLVGLALVLLGLYEALFYTPNHCLPSTPQNGSACDVGEPSHPRFLLGLLIIAAGIAIVIVVRRRFAYFDNG
jgi:hypothetical protein